MNKGYDQFFKQAKKNATVKNPAAKTLHIEDLRQQMAKQRRPRKSFPVPQFFVFVACCVGLFFAVEQYDKIEELLRKVEISIGVAQAETSKEAAPADKPHDAEKDAAASDKKSEDTAKVITPENEDSEYLFKLAERKKQLDDREEELNKKSAEIENEKKELDKKIKELEEYRNKISSLLQERIKSDDNKIDNLVQVYTNMKAPQAAKIFETMDEDLVIEILSRMKKKTAADILNLIKTEKAQVFAERYAGYRAPSSLPKTDNNKSTNQGNAP